MSLVLDPSTGKFVSEQQILEELHQAKFEVAELERRRDEQMFHENERLVGAGLIPIDLRGTKPVGFDPRAFVMERSARDERLLSVVQFLDRSAEERTQPGAPRINADGIFYRDTRGPFLIATTTAVVGTSEALLAPAYFTSLVAGYFNVGKKVKLTLSGTFTTAASSQGNVTLTARYGTTTGGTSIAASAATALAASKTNITWCAETYVHCRSVGATGTVLAWGRFMFDGAGAIFTTAAQQPLLYPASAPAATTIDTTTAQGVILDVTLGSATDSITVTDLMFEALN